MRWTVTTVLLALLLMAEQQAAAENEPKVITLSCDGTVDLNTTATHVNPEPMQKMGVVVNLEEQTVFFLGNVARINYVDAANIHFDGERILEGLRFHTKGDIDRVTGHMIASSTMSDPSKQPSNPGTSIINVTMYDVLCKVTNRVF